MFLKVCSNTLHPPVMWPHLRQSPQRGIATRPPLRALRPLQGPAHEIILQILVRHVDLARADLPRTDTPAVCTVSGSPETSGCHQYKISPLRHQPIAAGRRQPCDARACRRRQRHAILHLGRAIGVVAAVAGLPVRQPAADVGEIGAEVSSSCSFDRQQRPQPSHRLSHSTGLMSPSSPCAAKTAARRREQAWAFRPAETFQSFRPQAWRRFGRQCGRRRLPQRAWSGDSGDRLHHRGTARRDPMADLRRRQARRHRGEAIRQRERQDRRGEDQDGLARRRQPARRLPG